MATPAETFALVLAIGIPVGAAAYVIWRMLALSRGIVFRTWVWALLLLGYLAILAVVVLESWFQVSPVTGVLDVVLAATAGVLGARFTFRTVAFERDPDGRWIFRGRPFLLAVWFILFVARLGVELATFGHIFLFAPVPSQMMTPASRLVAFVILDALFAGATGLLIGGHFGLFLRYRRVASATDPLEVPRGAYGKPRE